MRSWKGLAALMAAALALAGCGGTGDGTPEAGFTITGPDAAGAYTFEADASGDAYTWDFGDHTPPASGASVTHTYSFANGRAKVTLTATTGGVAQAYHQDVVRGTGVNEKATFLLEAEKDWLDVGEQASFTGSGSFDPDHDARVFGWSCQKVGEPKVKPVHSHGKVPPFKAPPAGSVTSGLTNRTLPAPTKTYSGDLCAGVGSGDTGVPLASDLETIRGGFTAPGIYLLFMTAADGPNPAVSGQFKVFVTAPGERPPPQVHFELDDTLLAGAPAGATGQLQAICDNSPQPTTCDTSHLDFALPAPGAAAGWVNFTYDTGAAGNKATWTLMRGENLIEKGDGSMTLPAARLVAATDYRLVVVLEQGVQVPFHASLDFHMDLDPYRLYE